MKPIDIIFNAISQMTGGLISDITSLVTGMVVLGFIAMGIDHVRDSLNAFIARSRSRKYLTKAERARDASLPWDPNSVEYEQHQLLYRRYLNRSVDEAEKGGSL